MDKKSFIALCIWALSLPAFGQTDTTTVAPAPKRNLIQKVVDYISGSNDEKPAKKLDFSVIGGPYYSQDIKFGIGIVAAGIYHRNLADTVSPASQFSLYGDASITGYYKVGIDGSSYFKGDRIWLYYDMYFSSMPDRYWGIGYAQNHRDDLMVKYKKWVSKAHAAALFRLGDSPVYLGPVGLLSYYDAKTQPDPELWHNQKRRTFTDAWGIALVIDTRDNVYNAYKGVYGRIDQLFAPKFLGNNYAFSATEGTFNFYQQLWRGCVMATNLHARFTYGNTPWGMMSTLGGSTSMRGYWDGRYNDKCAAEVCVELRQYIWNRFGAVVWGGVGEVFPSAKTIFKGHALWNAGVGIRWEFKHRVNVRVDYGFGQNQNGLVFSINEAF